MNQFVRITLVLTFALGIVDSAAHAAGNGGIYAKIEASFELPSVAGNPFDFTQNDVDVVFKCPDGSDLRLPAFFDGGQTWRVRHSPRAAGSYAIGAVLLNGTAVQPVKLNPDHFEVSGTAGPGFIRVSSGDKNRFQFDNGTPYYPMGYDLAWQRDGEPSIPQSLEMMGKAGVNWSRIWMCSWDGKALDWFDKPADQPPEGTFGFSAIRKWDAIVDAAEASHIYFQLTLQQHGQYSTHADNNWKNNPWSKSNGGWLNNATDFFTDPKAIALTRSKYRYIIARWGYSPSIMAWELFNEVESVDAFKQDLDAVGRWHADMAKFIREQDAYHHLITTSSVTAEPKLWPAMDYYQCHAYPPDLLSAVAELDSQNLPRPFFYGEIGASTFDGDPDPGDTIHRVLWGSMMSQSAGAAQYWFWELVEPRHLLSQYTMAQKFIENCGMLNQPDLRPVAASIDTPGRGPLQFGPAIGWAKSKTTHFVLNPDGTNEGVSGMSAYLQGRGKTHEMFPQALFDVNFQTAGTFAVRFDQITTAGARVELAVDDHKVTTVDIASPAPAVPRPGGRPSERTPKIDTTVEIPLTPGPHSIRLENSGGDWIHIQSITLSPYAPTLAVLGKANDSYAMLWIRRRSTGNGEPVSGTMTIPALRAGDYTVTWWDTDHGGIVKSDAVHVVSAAKSLVIKTPPIAKDMAVWIQIIKR